MTLILVERRRGHVGRWSWWREGHVVEGSLIGGGVRGGWRPEVQDVCIIYLETFSSSNPSAVLLPASLLPYWRRWNFDLGYALLGLFSMLALSCSCLAQVTIWSANTLSISRASFSGEHLLCRPAAASWCATSFYSSSSSFDICVARIIVVSSRTA